MAKKKAKAARNAPSAKPDESTAPAIEDAMAELSEVVQALESGQESLDDSLRLFERGMALLRICHRQLDAAAQRIEIITRMTESGEIETVDFESTDSVTQSSRKNKRTESDGGLFQ